MFRHTIAAAKKGKPSRAFKWMPRARTNFEKVLESTFDLRVSRLVRGVMFVVA